MSRHDVLRMHKPRRLDAIIDSHGEKIADRDDEQLNRFARYPLHVAEQRCISSVVNPLGCRIVKQQVKHPTAGRSAVTAVG